jgi:hypothetical protein
MYTLGGAGSDVLASILWRIDRLYRLDDLFKKSVYLIYIVSLHETINACDILEP